MRFRSDGRLIGQEVSDQTLRDLAQAFNGFEPPAHIPVERIQLDSGREVLTLHVDRLPDTIPFTREGHAYDGCGIYVIMLSTLGTISCPVLSQDGTQLVVSNGTATADQERAPDNRPRMA